MSNKISILIIKKHQGTISAQELEELEYYASQSDENRKLIEKLTNPESLLDNLKDSYRWYYPDDLQRINQHLGKKVVRVKHVWYYAAAFALSFGFLLWWLYSEKKVRNTMIL